MMDHRDIVKRGIDCASCHFDVIRGGSTVTARECTHCHDQESYIAEFAERTVETVAKYHRAHVAAQHARCTDCHQAIEHSLVNPTAVGTSADFIQPVIDDCQHCHANHHREQVELLMGVGGVGVTRPMPNAMFGSRLNCRGCHTQGGSDFKGDLLLKATEEKCVACHSQDYETLFRQWRSEIASALEESQAALQRVDGQVTAHREAGRTLTPQVESWIAEAHTNIQLVAAGNGIHNKNYAIQLLDIANRNLDSAIIALAKETN